MELALLDVQDIEQSNGVNMFRRRVLHEFGHALGFWHEQYLPEFWDELTPEFKASQAGKKLKEGTKVVAKGLMTGMFKGGNTADNESIMMYPFKRGDMKDGYVIGWNTQLSDQDKRLANEWYGKSLLEED